jgi:hypothetical protein
VAGLQARRRPAVSLAPAGNRSVLGYNTVNSLDCLRILPAGKTQEILAIE